MSKVLEILAECQAICDAATPPPWNNQSTQTIRPPTDYHFPLMVAKSRYGNRDPMPGLANATFAAHARTFEPRFIEALLDMRNQLIEMIVLVNEHDGMPDVVLRTATEWVDNRIRKILQPEPKDKPEGKTDETK